MNKKLYSALTFTDPDRAIALLGLLGFREALVVRDPEDPTQIQHAEFTFNDGAGVMWATPRPDRVRPTPAGGGNVYLTVEEASAVDDLYARLLAFGCESINEPEDPDYGGRMAGVRDPEGNCWSFGTYAGA